MMPYHVRMIDDTSGLKDFLGLPDLVYLNDPKWVPPLHSETIRTLDAQKNPYFKNADVQKYVCYKDSKPIARSITVINQNHWLKFGTKTGFFGFFESLNDQEAVTALFNTMSEYCRKMGCEILEGPFNPNHYSELGLLIKNFTEPVFFETYNPEYYPTLITGAGFKLENTLHTRLNSEARKYIHEKPINDLSKASDKGFQIRPFSLFHMKRDLECIREVYNDAFSKNWHFLSLSEDEYSFSAKSLFLVTKP